MEYKVIDDIKHIMKIKGMALNDFSQEIDVPEKIVKSWVTGESIIQDEYIPRVYEYALQSGINLNYIKEQLYREEISRDGISTLLYHGSKNGIMGTIKHDNYNEINDYGIGFYCGTNYEQTAMFVSVNPKSSIYPVKFNSKGLTCKKFGVEKEWLYTILYFSKLLEDYKDSKIVKDIVNGLNGVDYIISPIADNRKPKVLNRFVKGEITDVQCVHSLPATSLGNQYVLMSKKAVDNLEVLERCYFTDTERKKYYDLGMNERIVYENKAKMAEVRYANEGKYFNEIFK